MRDNGKQAYLIMAHRDDKVFRTLLHMLDDEENDIYIHMDIKNSLYDECQICKLVRRASIYHTFRSNVMWGGYSQINAEYLLLKMATNNGHYNHLHLMSGQDLPIKPQTEIKRFFMENSEKEFVAFDCHTFEFPERVWYKYFFQEFIGKNTNWNFYRILQSSMVILQKKLHIKRNTDIKFQKGCNWFSITDSLARYIVEKEDWVKKTFKHSFCADEVFLQTIVLNSPFIDNLYYNDSGFNTMRFIDWKRGQPYVFGINDLGELKSSRLMFARKFDADIDESIVDEIYNLYGVK